MNDDMDFVDDEEGIEFSTDLITLIDEDDVEHTFELVETIEHGGTTYVALLPADILEENQELVIMKIVEEDDEEDILELIDDDEEFEEVSEMFESILADLFEFDDEDDE